MSRLLRPARLQCFYCGGKSAQKQNGSVRQFKCESCEAVNHLDAHGQITDPPAFDSPLRTAPNTRFVRPPTTQPSFSSDDFVFCDRCLKNQHLVRENLAAYLPNETSPDYSRFLASFDSYRDKLELRYPQVCAQCAPKAREKIKRAGYVAKTDHLRRMVDKSRNSGAFTTSGRAWRTAILSLAGLTWYSSAAIQLIWHAYTTASLIQEEDKDSITLVPSLLICTRLAVQDKQAHPACIQHLTPLLPYALAAALLTCWWNNRLRARYIGSGGRMIGTADYYLLQALTLVVRSAAYWTIANPQSFPFDSQMLKGLHAVMAVFLLIVTLISSRLVKIDSRNLISFYARDDQILPNLPPSSQHETPITTPSRKTEPSVFSISKLATPSTQSLSLINKQQPFPYQDNEDVMDWTPERPTPNNVNLRARIPPQSQPGQSPFRGTLPIAPPKRMHHPRAGPPPSNVQFRKASAAQQTNFFQNLRPTNASLARNDDDTSETDDDDAPATSTKTRATTDFQMAPPRFFAKKDVIDTGLEKMFDEVFSFEDERDRLTSENNNPTYLSDQDTPRAMGVFDHAGFTDGMPMIRSSDSPSSWSSTRTILLVGIMPLAILFFAAMLVKRGNWSSSSFPHLATL